jgi:uncharacterized protein YlxW (UPF0749 family)
MRDLRNQTTIAAVAFVLGLLVVVQLRSQTGGSALQALSAQDLTSLVASLNQENDHLRSEVGALGVQLSGLAADKRNGETSVGELRSELARFRVWAGLDPVSGRGVTITVAGRIEGRAIDDLLNELRNAGAEAITVGDVRVVSRTTVSGQPGALAVDGFALSNPFTVRAIGKPETIVGSLTRAGGMIAQLAFSYPEATIEVQPTDQRMTLPASSRDLVPDHGQPRL